MPRIGRAAPHLGEIDQSGWTRWIMLGGVIIVLVIFVVVVVVPSLTRAVAPAGISLPPTRTPFPAILSPVPTVPSATVPPPTAAGVKYRVRSGDTLSAIAQKFRVTVTSIMLANDLKSETIYANQELIIPTPMSTPTP